MLRGHTISWYPSHAIIEYYYLIFEIENVRETLRFGCKCFLGLRILDEKQGSPRYIYIASLVRLTTLFSRWLWGTVSKKLVFILGSNLWGDRVSFGPLFLQEKQNNNDNISRCRVVFDPTSSRSLANCNAAISENCEKLNKCQENAILRKTYLATARRKFFLP